MILVVLTIHFFEFVYIYLLHNYHLPITTRHLTFTKIKPFPRLENNYCFFTDYFKQFNCQEINYNACIYKIKKKLPT